MIHWHALEKKLSFRSMLFYIHTVTFRSENSGKTGNFEVIDTKDWSNVIPFTKTGKILMVKQFRFGSAELSLEFPAGVIEKNEEAKNAAERELREETGSIFAEIKHIGTSKPNPAFLSNCMYHYLATGVEVQHEQKLDHFEEIEVVELTEKEVDEKILNGEINHALCLAAWSYYKLLKA